MWLKTGLLAIKKRLSLSLSHLQRHRRNAGPEGSVGQSSEDTWLEAEHRRCNARAGIDGQVRHFWDAHYEPPRVAELLSKYRLRTKKTEGLEDKARKRSERNTVIKRLSEYEGYRKIIVPFLAALETDAYYKLRHPEEKNAAADKGEMQNSMDWYIGKQNGRLEVIEDFRLMVTTALAELQMDRARAEANKNKGGEDEATE